MQTNARLVKDVRNARQLATDLGGQADALGLTAGKRAAGPIEAQVAQANVQQETQAETDFLEDVGGDEQRPFVHPFFGGFHPVAEFAQIHAGEFADGFVFDFVVAGFPAQARPLTFWAFIYGHEVFGPGADALAAGFLVPAQDHVDQAIFAYVPDFIVGDAVVLTFLLAAGFLLFAVKQHVEGFGL